MWDFKKENEPQCSAPQSNQYLEATVSGQIFCLEENSGVSTSSILSIVELLKFCFVFLKTTTAYEKAP